MSFPVPKEYNMPDITYNNGNVITLPPSLSGDGTGVDLSQLEKDLILNLFSKAAYAENDAGTAYDTLENLWTAPTKDVESITAVYTQSGTVYDTDTLDSLKNDLIVTANYYDGTSETVIGYTLSGSLTVGTSTITVTYAGLTDTFSVTVSHAMQDTTAQIATSGKILVHLTNEYTTRNVTNGGITVMYEMDAATTTLFPAGIIPTDSVDDLKDGNNVACLFIYDSNNEPVNFVNELTTSSLNRWAQNRAGTMTEYSNSYTVDSYSKIAFSVDTRYLDDAYMYDKATGQVWFAGINTPYYGKHNISDS